jgi:hypothetical protein
MLEYASMLRFFGQFFVKSEQKLDVLCMQINVVNGYTDPSLMNFLFLSSVRQMVVDERNQLSLT